MDVEGIDALAEELGAWIVNMASKPYDGSTEAELFCPYHEHPETSQKPSATWQPKAKALPFELGVFCCHRPGCHLPSDGRKVKRLWHKAQALREDGETTPNPDPDDDGKVVEMRTWKPSEGNIKPPRRKGRATIEPPIDSETWDVYREFLYDEPDHIGWFLRERGITADTLRKFNWAWHQGKECFIFPVYRLDGEVEGWRLYDPFHLKPTASYPARDKKRWYRTRDHHSNRLWGIDQFDGSDEVILWEGETDTMLAHQDGITNGITQTGGAGHWSPEFNAWFKGKKVYTCYDPDEAGQIGRERVASELCGHATGVYHIEMPEGLDYSEWRKAGHEPNEFIQLVHDAKEAWNGGDVSASGLPRNGVPLKSVAELKDVNADKIVTMRSYVAGKKGEPWRLPKVLGVTCHQNAGKKCDRCPMFTGARNQEAERDFTLSPANADGLVAMMGAQDAAVFKLIAIEVGLRCQAIGLDPKEVWHAEQVSIQDPVDASNSVMADTRYSAYHFYDGATSKIEPSHDYKLVGRRLADPRNQSLAIVAWGAERTTTDLDTFQITPKMKRELASFRPRRPGSTWLRAKLRRKYRDLAINVTKIAMRDDLHLLYDLVAHSASEFDYNGIHVRKGMLDALVIGDTRTGKSETVDGLNRHYGVGYMVSGENSSFAGLVGGSAEMTNSRERMPAWGVLPRHHKRMVVIDEVSGLGDLLAQMSDVRSSGRAQIVKMGGGEVPAKVRLLWMGNPIAHDRSGQTRALSKYRQGAVGAITDLVRSQEDIARFDIAMAVVTEDVPGEAIYELRGQTADHEYTSRLCHSMAMFAWTRKRDQITFAPGVVHLIQDTSKALAARYISQPPLVQGSNVDTKLARMCVSLATMMYSTADDGETVVVLPEHVEFIREFVQRVYDHEHFGYGRMSVKQHEFDERGAENHGRVKAWLTGGKVNEFKHAGMDGPAFCDLMEVMESGFSLRDLRDHADVPGVTDLVSQMASMGMLQRQGQRYVPSTELLSILRQIEAEQREAKQHD